MADENRRMSEQFGDLGYEYDLLDHLDPIARAGFDPSRVRVGDLDKKGQNTAYYQPVGDIINIGPSQLSSKATHAHEFRERGINILMKEISDDSLAFRKKYGDELYFQLLDLKIAIEAQNRPQMIEDGEYNKNFAEMISEFYEKHESYNKPTGPYVEGEDVPPFSYNRKTRQPNTAAERLALLKAYADERGLPVRQGMRVINPEEQFKILETDNQSAFREYLQTNPADRVEGAFFRGAFRGDDTEKNRPLFESVDLLRQFAEEQNKKRGIRNPEEYFVVKPREQFAQGGPVMRGIGTLNETARNMNRGPRGIGAYQQFAYGGPVADSGKAFDDRSFPSGLPSGQMGSPFGQMGSPIGQMGSPIDPERYTGALQPRPHPQMGSPFDQPSYGFSGQMGSSFDQRLSGQLDNGFLGKYRDYLGQKYGAEDAEIEANEKGRKIEGFIQSLRQQEQDTFGGSPSMSATRPSSYPSSYAFDQLGRLSGSSIYETSLEKQGPMGPPQGLQALGVADMPFLSENSDLKKKFFPELFASGGEAMGPPPTRGPDPQGIGAFQQFADGGPVYMQEGGPPSAGEIKSEILDAVYEAESNSNYDQWHLNAKNIPEKPLTEMTVEEIMRYQGDNKGPAAGAGQIKFDTLQYLIDYGTIQPTDVFTVETQDKAHSRLLDRRGFQSWVSGEMSNTDFGQNVAKEYAGIPLLADEEVNGVLRPRGSSRYGGSNVARIGLDDWEGLLATAKTATPDYGTVAAVNSEAKSPFIETLTMRGEDVAMSMPVEQSERMSELGQENLADGRYFQGTKPEDVMTPSVGELLSSKYSRPRTQEAAEAKQRAMDRSKQTSLYEQFAPEGVQDLFSGIGSYIRGEEPQQEEEVNVYGSPPAKPPETFRKFLKPNSTIL
jgi:hypothetical protein